jgi:hypothetical protein
MGMLLFFEMSQMGIHAAAVASNERSDVAALSG